MKGTSFHMCVDIRGLLDSSNKELKHLFKNKKTGEYLTPQEARNELYDYLQDGWDVLPMGEKCDNFDKKKGCLGHKED